MLTPDQTYLVAVFLVVLFLYLVRSQSDLLPWGYALACWHADDWLVFTVLSGFVVFVLIADGVIRFAVASENHS